MNDLEDELGKLEGLIEWKDKYSKLGVSPIELYMRQNGLCFLVLEDDLYCTDGKDKAKTSLMLNPTIECVNCLTCFVKNNVKIEIKK